MLGLREAADETDIGIPTLADPGDVEIAIAVDLADSNETSKSPRDSMSSLNPVSSNCAAQGQRVNVSCSQDDGTVVKSGEIRLPQ
jgi:hypothetical protein